MPVFKVWASKFNCNTYNQEKKTEQLSTVKSRKKCEETGVAFGVGPDTYVFILSRYFGELSLLRNGEFSGFIGKSLGRFGKKQVDYAKSLAQCQEQRR